MTQTVIATASTTKQELQNMISQSVNRDKNGAGIPTSTNSKYATFLIKS
jgi:hypothetical protein